MSHQPTGNLDPRKPGRRRWAPLLLLPLLAWWGSTSCAGGEHQQGSGDPDLCKPGELRCVCDENQSCQEPWVCIADRCLDLEAELSTTGNEDSPAPDEDNPKAPEPQEPQGPEDATQGDDGGAEPQPEDPEPEGPGEATASGGKNPGDDSGKGPGGESGDDSGKDSGKGSGDASGKDSGDDSGKDSGDDSDDSGKAPSEKEQCSDFKLNGRETDIDCGGPVCSGCLLGQSCRAESDCISKHCVEGSCVECVADFHCDDGNPCTIDRCSNNVCQYKAERDGSRCNDNNPCTAQDRCSAARCRGKSTIVLSDDFNDNSQGWRFVHGNGQGAQYGGLWEIGAAKASSCDNGQVKLGEDPGLDHSTDSANGVAGVVIGGCHERRGDRRWDCIWSKDVDISFFEEPAVISFWRHLHSPASDLGARKVINRVVYRSNISERDSITLKNGYPETTNDADWLYQSYELKKGNIKSIAVAVCYQKFGRAQSFAGWSIDDFKIRQRGCEMTD